MLKITTETSSAANVRRIEAITGQVAIDELRRHDRVLAEAARVLRTSPEQVAEIAADREAKRRELEKRSQQAAPVDASFETVDLDGVKAAFEIKQVDNPKALPDIADRIKNQLGDPAVVVLGAPGDGRATLLVAATPGRGRARREGRRGHQGGGRGRRRRRWRPGQHGPGGRARAGQAARRPGGRARGDRAALR